jgi:MFS family permease
MITVGLVISTISQNFSVFFIGRVISALGCGAQIPSTYSIIADIIPAKFWSTLYGTLALLISISNGLGQFMSGFLSPLNIWGLGWKFPFALLAILSVACYLLILLIRIPNRGASDVETVNAKLGEEIRKGKAMYNYTIKKEDLKPLWKINSNRWMLYLCFFAVIPGATLGTFLVYYLKINPFSTFPTEIITQVAQIYAAMSGLGYFFGTFTLGVLFDKLHAKSPKYRAKFTYLGLILAIPLFVIGLLCIVPIDYDSLGLPIVTGNPTFETFVITLTAIFEHYPTYIAYFFLMLIGSYLASPLNINRNPTMLEVNLPEHMGSSQGEGLLVFYLRSSISFFPGCLR